MPEATIKDLQTDYAQISAKVQKQEQALSPDAIANASVSDLATANKEILADVQALREKIETNKMSLPDGREIFRHEYEALQQLARENGIEEEEALWRLTEAKIRGGQVGTINLSFLNLSTIAALGALSGLVELNLGLNAIQGDPLFPALLKLQKLDLGSNKITGVSGLSRLTGLTALGLFNNAIEGDPQFPALPKLQTLYLNNNRIAGLSGLSPLTGLTTLSLDVNTKSQLRAELKELEQRGLTVDG